MKRGSALSAISLPFDFIESKEKKRLAKLGWLAGSFFWVGYGRLQAARQQAKKRDEQPARAKKPNNSAINEEKLNLFDFSLLIVNWVGYERTAPICRREIDSIAR